MKKRVRNQKVAPNCNESQKFVEFPLDRLKNSLTLKLLNVKY